MKKSILILFCLFTLGAVNSQILTGAAIVQALREAGKSIVNNAGEQAKQVANEAAARLATIASELERVLGNNINKPLSELNSTLRVQTDRALVALQQSKDFINSMLPCIKADLKSLISSFNRTLTNNVSNITFWRKKEPLVFNIEKLNAGTSYGFRVNSKATFILQGANFNINNRCEPEIEISNIDAPDEKIPAKILQYDQQNITIATDAFKKTGLYEVEISYYARYLLGCRNSKTVKAYISVLPVPVFKLSYSITPICERKEIIPFNAGRIDDTNDGCDGDKFPEIVGTLPPDLTYVSHAFIEESKVGEKQVDQYLGGNQVRIKYRLPKPECICYLFGCKRIGGRTWVHGTLIINGLRTTTNQGDILNGNLEEMTYDQTRTFKISNPSCSENISKWVVSVQATDPEGKLIDIPPMEGNTVLTNSVNGLTYYWEPTSKSLSITTPNYSCK